MRTTTRRNRPTHITDAPEHRSIPIERVELRDSADDENEIVLEGYASTFEEYEMYGGPAQYGWIERIDPKAFDVTLREKPDLHLLINHAGMPLARTKSGNLDLKADKKGLKVTARLDKRDPEVQSLAVKMERGDMDEMSFAFRVKGQEWRAADGFDDDDQSYRTVTEVSLHKGDVSVVNWGANPTTSVGLRSVNDALKVLADCDDSELAEIRGDDDTLKRAIDRLAAGFAKAPVVNIETLNVTEDVRSDDAANSAEAVDETLAAPDEVQALEDAPAVEERADGDDDPSALLAGIDAAVDQAIALTEGVDRESLAPEVTQALDLLVAIDALVDELMDLTGTYDPDEATEADEAGELSDTETVDEVRSTRLDEALAAQGILPEKLSLAAALAFED